MSLSDLTGRYSRQSSAKRLTFEVRLLGRSYNLNILTINNVYIIKILLYVHLNTHLFSFTFIYYLGHGKLG